MKNKGLKETVTAALLYGSLWGIMEAVLGYLLHMLPFGLSAFIMFPVGFFFMERGYRQTQKTGTILYIGIVAAAVKLTDLFLPLLPVIKTLNPAISILLESSAVMAGIALFTRKGSIFGLSGSIFISTSWRIIYALYAFVLTLFSIRSDIYKNGLASLFNFLVLNGAVNAAIIFAYLKLRTRLKAPLSPGKFKIGPLISASLFAVAVSANIIFTIL